MLIAPFAVRPDMHNELQPDVLVARYSDLTMKDLPKPPVLAVEVASASSRLTDADYRQVAHVVGDQVFAAERPFVVRIMPAELVRGLQP